MRDKESIQREIAALGLPPIVSLIFDGTAPRPALSYRCAAPSNSLVDGSGFPEHLLPLWECGTSVVAFDPEDHTFCKIDLESPDEPRFRVGGFDEMVADVLIDLWEDEVADDILSDVADLFRFSRLPPLVAALESGSTGDYDTWRATLRNDNCEQDLNPNA